MHAKLKPAFKPECRPWLFVTRINLHHYHRKMMHNFATGQWVPYPVEFVFAFFANPANLPALMPPKLKARIDDLQVVAPSTAIPDTESIAAGAGSEILISFRPVAWLPLRVSWRARIVEFVWNSHFIDEQVRGPFASFRHRHGTTAEKRGDVGGTLVTDAIEYRLPGGALGSLGSGVMRKQLESSFAYRQKQLPRVLAARRRDESPISSAR